MIINLGAHTWSCLCWLFASLVSISFLFLGECGGYVLPVGKSGILTGGAPGDFKSNAFLGIDAAEES